ncbi:MAG: cadmium-translocating P-type ATPase [Chloroflexi bacterium]|nr:MAG: cadmium-translocating P-type ATPase [Chloroflexota bacterium]MBL1195003.1 cadmium-translocating P-type ATPase [Chloroflexota bacterium]NOH12292.1 cadmium-translocating P-type ATPase [Chloroflexota bacterium]
MNTIIQKFQNPRTRRQFLVISSGALIMMALGVGKFLGAEQWRNGFMILATLIAGWDIAVRAVTSLRNRHISIELLVTIATVGALIIGEYWEAAAVTFLFILGAYLEARTLSQTRQVLEGLLDLTPATAIVIRDNRQVEVSPHEVLTNEMVMVKPGAKIAVDGEVIDGHSSVDESAITGEPMPEEKSEGAQVYAGTVNQAGLLKVRATGVGADTTLARIIRRVEEAQEEKAPTQRFIEQFSQWYTPFIIGLSGLAYLITRDIELALTLLVIGCPGALVISTPVSVVAGIGRAAKSGILIKGGEYLENAGKISALALDKTGTLTQGKPELTDVVALNGHHQDQILRWAAIAEAGSEHPLARAIMKATEHLDTIPSAEKFDTCTGRGVRATLNGDEIGVGSKELMAELGVDIPLEGEEQLTRLKSAGKTAVLVSLNDLAVGILGIADTLRADAPKMIKRLKEIGLKQVVMLTGDDRRTAQAIAAEAGIDDVRAELLPEDKLQAIRALQADGHVVAMVGDGINDAPALAAADIGIAMGAAGTDIAIETADIALMADDLMKLPEAVKLSKATLGNIRQNVVVALVTVTGLLLGVILGAVHMSGGMLIHEASVLVVILNGMRLLRK